MPIKEESKSLMRQIARLQEELELLLECERDEAEGGQNEYTEKMDG